jgi:hypothetical protein
VWVSSPEPAVGVFTTAGTCQVAPSASLVIGFAAPDRTRLPKGSAAIGFGGGAWAGQGAARWPETRPGGGDEDQGVTLSSAGTTLGATGDEQSLSAPDSPGQRAVTSPRPRTDLNASGCRYRNLRI